MIKKNRTILKACYKEQTSIFKIKGNLVMKKSS